MLRQWRLPQAFLCSLVLTLGCTKNEDGAGAAQAGAGGSAGASAAGATTGGAGSNAGGAVSGGAAGNSGAAGATTGGSSGGVTGGAAGNAGTAGASGAATTACAAGNVCDDFESYQPGAGFGDWKQNGTNGTLEVNATHVFSGQQSAHFSIDAGGNKRLQLERTGAPIFPAKDNILWGRVMVWAGKLPQKSNTEDKNVHYDVIQASGATPGEYRVAGMGNVLLNYEPHDCYYGTDKPIPEDKWACWEWLFDGKNDTLEFYIDGALQAKVAMKGQGCVDGTDSVWDAPEFNKLRLGWVNYQSKGEANELWMDDFAVGPARVGCPASAVGAH